MATMEQAARHIDVEKGEFLELIGLGVIEHKADGNYNLDELRRNYLRYLNEVIAGRAPDTKTAFGNVRKSEGRKDQ
jgi:hypothetical protein